MLLAGYSLVQLVMVTTALRIVTYFVYRLNAYKVFPALSLDPKRFLWSRVRELTGFSVYVSIIDWANKLNYSIDAIIIGAYMGARRGGALDRPAAARRDAAAADQPVQRRHLPGRRRQRRRDRSRSACAMIFIQGTRLSLVSVVPLAAALFLLARSADSRLGRVRSSSTASSSRRF